jgi:LDH2 family malate/lactate/ureidoglycolate dehydrogenase
MSGTLVERYDAADLLEFGTQVLSGVGVPIDRAYVVAQVLLEADLLGRTTHGYSLLPPYLHSARNGGMQATGNPTVKADTGSVFVWDGQYLPGPWLVRHAIDEARTRLTNHPVVTGVIRRSHHIACLQSYLKAVTDQGLLILLTASVPSLRQVAPFGSVEGCYSPNPFAAGIPTDGEPMLLDISLTTTAGFHVTRTARAGARLQGKWLVDDDGNPTDDPAPFVDERRGALYNLGGADLGYKGFGLALVVEALTSGLAGYGRADGEERWSSSVFVQIIDPERFGGRAAFLRETSFLAEACRDSAVPPGAQKVHLPGHAALARRAAQLREGVALHPSILPELVPWAEELDVPIPLSR